MTDPRLNQYTVSVAVSGSIDVIVEARDEDQARYRASHGFRMSDVDMDVDVCTVTLTREALDEADVQLTGLEEATFMLTGKIPPVAFERMLAEQMAVPA